MRGNDSPLMNKALSKAFMVRTKHRNTFLKKRSEENKKSHNMQRNYCVSLSRKSKRDYYNSLNEKNTCDNRPFWKVVKPLLSNKIVSNEKITLVEGKEIVKIDHANAKVLNNFFSQCNQVDPIWQNIKEPVINYRNHPSIIAREGVPIRNSVFHSLNKMMF